MGRNQPCLCGSGKKYKRCCLARAAAVAVAYHPGDRADALEGLGLAGEGRWP